MERLYFVYVTFVSKFRNGFQDALVRMFGYLLGKPRRIENADGVRRDLLKKAQFLNEISEISSPDRLIQAVQRLWKTHGNAGLSARSIAQTTGLPVSSIYYHFGDMERLLLAAQDASRVAAEQWCAAHLDAIPRDFDAGPAGLPSLLAALIDDWSHDHRRLAFAWRECQLMAARDSRYLPALRLWQQLWSSFWQEICARCGMSAFGEMTNHLFDGESLLHLSRWRRAIDRAGLDEMCGGWSAWLDGRLALEGSWRRFARTEALRSMPAPSINGLVAEQIAAAAADTVAEQGVAGLTHRAVAARAGLSLGVVSYNFKTSADLLRAAFEMIYRRVVPFPMGERAPLAIAERGVALIDRLFDQDPAMGNLLALDELLVAGARDPELGAFAAQLRYLRGQTSGRLLQAMIGDARQISPLDAALFSGFTSGQRRSQQGLPPGEARASGRANLLLLLRVLDGGKP